MLARGRGLARFNATSCILISTLDCVKTAGRAPHAGVRALPAQRASAQRCPAPLPQLPAELSARGDAPLSALPAPPTPAILLEPSLPVSHPDSERFLVTALKTLSLHSYGEFPPSPEAALPPCSRPPPCPPALSRPRPARYLAPAARDADGQFVCDPLARKAQGISISSPSLTVTSLGTSVKVAGRGTQSYEAG